MSDATQGRTMSSRFAAALPLLLVVVVAGVAVAMFRGGDADDAPEAIDLVATGPQFSALDELVAAADVIVEGQIVAVDDGRAITDPADPTTGFTTALFQLDVERSFRGGDVASLIVEQEAALLDGTPIVVNGVEANKIGDSGFWFLVRGDDEAFPYVALVNEQARLLVDGSGVVATGFGESMNLEEFRARLEE